jgi:hypothetical protein
MDNEEEWIEHPITAQNYLSLDTIGQCNIRKDWSFLPIIRFWTMGYNQTTLSRWFDMIPPDIGFLLKRILAQVEDEMVSRIMHLKVLEGLCSRSAKVWDDVGLIAEPPEQSVWDGDETCPHLTIRYDPVTQERTNIHVNRKLSNLVGLHIEEFLSRFAAYDFGIPMPPEDFLYIMIDDMLNIPVSKKEIYHRLLATNGNHQGMLVVVTIIKTFNAAGEITQVKCTEWNWPHRYSTVTLLPLGAAGVQSHNRRGV